MALIGLVRRLLSQSRTKRLLRRMMLEYTDIRMSSAAVYADTAQHQQHNCEQPSPTGSSSSTCRASDASPIAIASRASQACAILGDDDVVDDDSDDDDGDSERTTAAAPRRSSTDTLGRLSESRLSISACVVVPPQQVVSEKLWIDKLRVQEATYKQSLGRSSVSSNNNSSIRRRCESEDDAFEMWDYVCPQLVRPQLANEWV